MSEVQVDSFRFLQSFWPDLHELGRGAEQALAHEPELVAIKLRGLTETMVVKLFGHLGLQHNSTQSHFARLVQLEASDLLDARLLSKFHTIRKLGNDAAHSRKVTRAQAETLVEDGWSLSCWFCRFIRPDVEWFTPTRSSGNRAATQAPDGEPSDRQPTVAGRHTNIVRFPEERVRRIQEQVSRAMAAVDPRVRALRTRITLPEAFTEQLSDDQSACLDALSAFLDDRTKRIFLLKGYAGTGKTFLAKGITEFLSMQGRAFRLGAPTGRAAKIISEKTGRDARTVHSQIYDFGDLREYAAEDEVLGSETFKFYAKIASNQDQANTVYIVDEASLLSDAYSESEFFRSGTGYLLQDLISYVGFEHGETDRKIIFVGDPAQLPPVGMATSPALDIDYLRKHFGLTAVEYELREVLRQKADSGVIRNVMPLRESLSKGSFSSLSFSFDDDVQRLEADEVLPSYLATRPTDGGSTPIIITFSNSEAAGFNRAIRDALFPGREFVAAGDKLIVTANAIIDGTFVSNGEFVDVIDAETMVERRSVKLRQRDEVTGTVNEIEVSLTFRDVQLSIPSPGGSEMVITAKILDDHLHDGRAELDASQQRALYVDFLKRHPDLKRGHDRERLSQILRQDPYFNALRVRFGYAVTCHKAQGGEWQHVFVSCPPRKEPRAASYFRWLYTAMTRSSEKLYLVNPPHRGIKRVPSPLGGGLVPNADGASTGSPGEAFRMELLARVRATIAGTDIEVDDVAHYQYQESYYFRRDVDAVRVNISYNGRSEISAVKVPTGGPLNKQLGELLQSLSGRPIGRSAPVAESGVFSDVQPSRPFLKAFHDRLIPLLEARKIKVADLKEQAWSQRYTFSRDQDVAVVDVFYDGRDRLRSCMPVVAKRFSAPTGTLLPDVLEILTEQVIP